MHPGTTAPLVSNASGAQGSKAAQARRINRAKRAKERIMIGDNEDPKSEAETGAESTEAKDEGETESKEGDGDDA